MGGGKQFECSKCGKRYYANIGIGFLFSEVYSKTVEDITNGKYGENFKRSFESVKHAAVDAEYHLYKCKKCDHWDTESGMSLYAPNEEDIVVRKSYVMPYELKSDYHIYKRYIHKCEKCSSVMHKATNKELEELKCPYCGGAPDERKKFHMCWD